MSKIKCIIIDDEIEATNRFESLLRKLDNTEVIAIENDPDIALETIVELKPDLVFVDVEMPGMSGFDVVKAVRAQNISPTFIFVTAYSQYAIKAIRQAAFDFLPKPVDIDDLKEALERFARLKEKQTSNKIPQTVIKKYSLTAREIEIVQHIVQGKTSKGISEILFISKNTVDTHRRNILEKTKLKSSAELHALLF